MRDPRNVEWSALLVGALAAAGVRRAVVSPGSRSTPAALALAASPDLRTEVVVDERGAGFLALGLAKGDGAPVALLCTSGSAAAHYLPAVTEAWASGVPLVVLTADRPFELHGFGAPQTMPQVGLFGRFVVDELDAPAPDGEPASATHLVHAVARLVHRARSDGGGPVHLNLRFREPLAPDPGGPAPHRPVTVPAIRAATRLGDLEALGAALERCERPVILCGPREADDGFGDVVHALGARIGAPVLAEAASNARYGHADAIATYDVLARADRPDLAPDLVLRLGAGATARTTLARTAPRFVLLAEGGRSHDPFHFATDIVHGDATPTLRALVSRVGRVAPPAWRDRWVAADAAVRAAMDAGALAGEIHAARAVVAALPPDANLVVSSSMPIRDVDAFADRSRGRLRVYANRGLNGIDGLVATAAGVARASGRPTVLYAGDLALLHDAGSFVALRKLDAPLVVVGVNNDGGGIFHFLPVRARTERFEELFGTPHGLGLGPLAALGGLDHVLFDAGAPEVGAAVAAALASGRSTLVELRSDREANVEQHRRAYERLVAAVP